MAYLNEKIKDIIFKSPALKHKSELYPPNRFGKVPLKVKMAITVKSDLSMLIDTGEERIVAYEGQEYYVWCNSHGAMTVLLPNGRQLGIKSSECVITEWHDEKSV